MKRLINKSQRYHCPSCNEINSLFPAWEGRKRYYKCDKCEEKYSQSQLDKSWGITKQKNILEILKF